MWPTNRHGKEADDSVNRETPHQNRRYCFDKKCLGTIYNESI